MFVCVGLLFSAHTTVAAPLEQKASDTLLMSLRIDQALMLCGESVPATDPRVVERFEKEMLVALGNRPQVILWLKRSTRFFPYIEKTLAESGLPDDIKYLAVAESGLRLHAGSRKGAMGVWQLMPQTARKHGLTVNGAIDERRNVYLSTPAAVTYLKALYEQFGAWSLALAAYNMGEEGLEAQILEQDNTDYYRLYLPLETQRFIFRILAIKRILEAPEKYGFSLAASDFYAPLTFSPVQINAFADIPLRLIAKAALSDFKTIKELNPELRGYYLSAGTRTVSIPVDGRPGFKDRLATMVKVEKTKRSQRIYMVREGDSLSGIAKKFEVPLAALLIWNRMGINEVIHPGQHLVILPATRVPPAASGTIAEERDR
jgi:hypothetical protein